MRALRGRYRLLAIGLALGVVALVGYQCLFYRPVLMVEGIEVRGDAEFNAHVHTSLAMLRDNSPEAFAVTQQYIQRIDKRRRSGMRAYAKRPTFDLSPKTAYVSATWCAGAIAHDAYHSKLYHEYREAHGEPVPDSAWRGKAKELECIEFQLSVLKSLKAPEFEIQHLSNQDGSHFDLDGDGEETWRDYWKRDW